MSTCVSSKPDLFPLDTSVVCILVFQVSVDQDMPCEDYHGGSKEIQKDVLSLVNMFSANKDTVEKMYPFGIFRELCCKATLCTNKS